MTTRLQAFGGAALALSLLMPACAHTPEQPASRTPVAAATPAKARGVETTSAGTQAASASEPLSTPDLAHAFPSACDARSEICQPAPEFVANLCAARHPGIAVALFASATPFKRAYVRVKEIEAINTAGGRAGDENLSFDEEVLVLNRRTKPKGSFSVSGADGYLVLRWDGSCATVSNDEMTDQRPPKPLQATIPFNYLDDSIQNALLEDAAIRKLRAAQRGVCRGAVMSQSTACQVAARKLSDAVANTIRRGQRLPAPGGAI